MQIVYLPQQGTPVAPCVMKEAKADQPVAEQHIDHMNVVTWRRSSLGYVLIGQPGHVDLTALAKSISDNRVSVLYGEAGLPGRIPPRS
ncbi:hypothetical protein [Paraburkholderia hospita]|uniref:hypothetical protein n=1 Tax=Paraburkholderia hospita TaxID=169430 RepID=UPI000271B664|nr:hypothetical protein [Paraburkholderia hospita]EUC12358.1 hypothetical protein PMI06_008741 [Burkholderia sp. BT03]